MIAAAALPADSLLEPYRRQGAYTDCFLGQVAGAVTLGQLVAAFYDSRMFRPERWAIGVLLRRPAGTAEVAALAQGRVQEFSAWTVEGRTADQLLLCDYQQRTRSWLMVEPVAGGTLLRFGTAVPRAASGAERMTFQVLSGVHRAYAQLLLQSAITRLKQPG